jgi:hypothetical protein
MGGLLLAGFVGSASHCAVMCGPFVMSQTGQIEKKREAFLLPYHLGRITTYVGLGIVLSSLLNVAFLFLPIRSFVIAPLLLTAAVVFLVNAFPAMRSLFPWGQPIKTFLPYSLIEKFYTKLSTGAGRSVFQKYLLGVLLGFMPCGLIVAALMAASTAPNALYAGAAMAAFGLGTMPGLMVVGFGGMALQYKFPAAMKHMARGFMIISAAWLVIIATSLWV